MNTTQPVKSKKKPFVIVCSVLFGIMLLCCCISSIGYLVFKNVFLHTDQEYVQMLEKSLPTMKKYQVTEYLKLDDCRWLKYSEGYYFESVPNTDHTRCKNDFPAFDKTQPEPVAFTDDADRVFDELNKLFSDPGAYDVEADYTTTGEIDAAQFTVWNFSMTRLSFIYNKDKYITAPDPIANDMFFKKIEGYDHWIREDQDWM